MTWQENTNCFGPHIHTSLANSSPINFPFNIPQISWFFPATHRQSHPSPNRIVMQVSLYEHQNDQIQYAKTMAKTHGFFELFLKQIPLRTPPDPARCGFSFSPSAATHPARRPDQAVRGRQTLNWQGTNGWSYTRNHQPSKCCYLCWENMGTYLEIWKTIGKWSLIILIIRRKIMEHFVACWDCHTSHTGCSRP